MSKLGERNRLPGIAPAPAGRAAPGRFASAIAGSRPRREIRVAGLPAVMTVVGLAVVQRIEGEVFRALAELGLDPTVLTDHHYEAERARRTLAEAVRDPDDPGKPLGTVGEWGELSMQEVNAAWVEYHDLVAEADPIGQPLTEEEYAAIREAIGKKNATLLRSFGLARLSIYLATTDALPSTSPIPRSSSGSSSHESMPSEGQEAEEDPAGVNAGT